MFIPADGGMNAGEGRIMVDLMLARRLDYQLVKRNVGLFRRNGPMAQSYSGWAGDVCGKTVQIRRRSNISWIRYAWLKNRRKLRH